MAIYRDAYSEVADKERQRIEDAAIRVGKSVLLALLLDITGSLLGRNGAEPIPVVVARAAALMEPSLFDGFLASYLTGRQRSFLTAAGAKTGLVTGDTAIRVPGRGVAEAVSDGRAVLRGETVISPRTHHFNRPTFAIRVMGTKRVSLPTSGSGGVATLPRAGAGGGGGVGGSVGRAAAGGAGPNQPLSVNQLAARFHANRLNLTEDQIAALARDYSKATRTIAGQFASEAERAAMRISGELVQNPLNYQDAVVYIRNALGKAGITPARPHVLEAIYRTAMGTAYNAGQWEFDQDPAINEILWGYQYITVGDDRVCPICEPLHKLARPKDDPIWDEIWPLNHVNCRCVVRSIMKGDHDAVSTEIPDEITVPDNFRVHWGKVGRFLNQPA